MSGGFLWNEGPSVVKHNGVYYLMYSANCHCHRHYSVGYSTAVRPLGPYVKYSGNPILSARFHSGQGFPYLSSGTGHHSVIASPDGSELFIVYHSHADPLAGSGGRQLNIDRLGFREDGSMYVNGPSVTLQPSPSGTTNVMNITPEATVSASSTRRGFRTAALTDGEIGVDPLKAGYDWVSDGERAGAWVQLALGRAAARGVRPHLPDRAPGPQAVGRPSHLQRWDRARRAFSRGAGFGGHPAGAPRGEIEWIRFVAGEPVEREGEAGLSEIMVLGRPLGAVWISTPKPWRGGRRRFDPDRRVGSRSQVRSFHGKRRHRVRGRLVS